MEYELIFSVTCSTEEKDTKKNFHWKVFNKEDFIRQFDILVRSYMDSIDMGNSPKIVCFRDIGVSEQILAHEEK